MNSFQEPNKEATAVTVVQPPKLPENPIPPSRVKSDPKLWDESSELAGMLAFCRPHGSRTERKFIAKYLVPLGVKFDKFGNIYKQIGDNPAILFSSHTDTVHVLQGTQKIVYFHSKKTGDVHFEVDQNKNKSSCLGADDTCGIWLMMQMIRNNIPGLYIFHRGEEVGGKGSKWIAENNKDALKSIRFAIAFDRRDTGSIITYQRSTRCCSDEFANSLADQLGMGHKCDTTGSFTDTASYVDLIAECTNVSVGYESAHSKTEYTNVDYLFRLRDALLKADFSKLVEKRKPGENTREPYVYKNNYYDDAWEWGGGYGSIDKGIMAYELRQKYKDNPTQALKDYAFDLSNGLWYRVEDRKDLGVVKIWNGKAAKNNKKTRVVLTTTSDKPSYSELMQMIRLNPGVIGDLLETCGYGPKEVLDHLVDVACTGNTIHLG